MHQCSIFSIFIFLSLSSSKFCGPYRSALLDPCEFHKNVSKYLCHGIFKHEQRNKAAFELKPRHLVLCQLPGPNFDLRILSVFHHLHKLSLINSNISHFVHDFPEVKHLQVLNLTRLRLEKLSLFTFKALTELRILDLSHNRLKTFGRYLVEFLNKLQHLYLRGNNWECDIDFKWILSKKNSSLACKVTDASQMKCGSGPYAGRPLLIVLKYIKTMLNECPESPLGPCICSLVLVVWSPSDHSYVPIIKVNCESKGFTELPNIMPQNTTTLILKQNQISDLAPLANNAIYRGLSDLYLDNNNIKSVDILERSDFLKTFRTLSLIGNKLTTLPTYAFHYAFEKNKRSSQLFLGNNPWQCDCHFIPAFKELISKYHNVIADIDNVSCAIEIEDENSNKVIRDLSLSAVCREPGTDTIRPIDCINAVLFLLILFINIKLIYDYWIYKTTNSLPWIARKMP